MRGFGKDFYRKGTAGLRKLKQLLCEAACLLEAPKPQKKIKVGEK